MLSLTYVYFASCAAGTRTEQTTHADTHIAQCACPINTSGEFVQHTYGRVVAFVMCALCAIACADDGLGELETATTTAQETTPPTPSTPTPLVDHELWEPATESHDPWANERPETIDCPKAARRVEDGVFEILTGFCNYLSLRQNTLVRIQQGDTVTVVARHLDLLDEENPQAQTNAHIALRIGDWDVWNEELPIPNTPQFYTPNARAPKTFEMGTPITLHLHNHGVNTWYLVSVSVRGTQGDD